MNPNSFNSRESYRPAPNYRLLPFRFGSFDAETVILTNDVGEYALLSRADLDRFTKRHLDTRSEPYRTLKARHFLMDNESTSALDLLAVKYRTRQEPVARFTGLHIFVVTLRCDHSCHYCQVSRQTEDRTAFDMQKSHAEKAVELAFRSPSPSLKIEFQGGEPLLNFDLIRYIVTRAEEINQTEGRDLAFVIASNLSRLTDEILEFCRDHRVFLSTSLDGPKDLHDAQRPISGGSSYEATLDGVRRAREFLGPHGVAALMTTTPRSIERVVDIVDEYVRLGFDSVFLRSLSPYGFAASNKSLLRGNSVEDWVEFYKRGLARVIEHNLEGRPLREEFTTVLLQKILSPLGSSYVDLMSPAGLGLGALVYNYDGTVFASDEGRMLAEMGDQSLRLGHLDTDPYEEMMTSERFLRLLDETMLEGAPMCSECPFLPYCGSDPAFHLATQKDAIGHKAFSAFCKKQMAVLKHVISMLEAGGPRADILRSWV